MNDIIIFHGAYGYPEENWFDWLRKNLASHNINCQIPHFPTPENQSLTHWIHHFDEFYKPLIHSNTIFIGHSLGCAFILRWLERNHMKLPLVILTGAFIGNIGINHFDDINKSFFDTTFDWKRITSLAENIICIHGNNDPYVDMSHFNFIADQLSARKMIISQGGHLNKTAGYSEFYLLLYLLKQYLKISS